MKINLNFWKGKKVFVTGHTGFKGSWLCLWLLNLGATIKGYSLNPSTEPSLFNILNLEDKITSVIGDIRDGEKVKSEIRAFNPDIIFHLAAQPLVRLSYQMPAYTFETNIMGTVNVFEAIRSSKNTRAFICITSDKCYENREWEWPYREIDSLGGYDPYSASKGCAEMIVSSYRNSFFNARDYNKTHQCAIASARAGNVFGGGDWSADRIIPDCIRALVKGEQIVIRNPQAIRPWQHVFEPLFGYISIAEHLFMSGCEYGEAWNLGPGEDQLLNVENLVKHCLLLWGSGSFRAESADNLHEASRLILDTSKAKARLNIYPVFTINMAIEATINWYKNYYNRAAMLEFSTTQITSFEKLISNK
jgi:CDP-glucose 4,6-dehydratase